MTYSKDAVAFSQIPAGHQIRLEDRVSFLYLEHCSIRQEKTGVVALSADSDGEGQMIRRRVQIPVSGISVLQLGPGVSISSAALTSCTRAGATVLVTGGGGVPVYTRAVPLTSSARWAIAQARLVSSERHQRKAAVALYRRQLGMEVDPEETSIKVMRGLEGQVMKLKYREEARRWGVRSFKRDTSADDPINLGLNLANGLLYGCAASACASIGVNPALGIIHRGDVRSLLYDLADLYKPTVSIPVAFAGVKEDDPLGFVRREVRARIHRQQMLKNMLAVLMELLEPHLPDRDDDRLVAGRGDEVAGHTQYGKR